MQVSKRASKQANKQTNERINEFNKIEIYLLSILRKLLMCVHVCAG